MTKYIFKLTAIILTASIALIGCKWIKKSEPKYTIAIVQLLEHPDVEKLTNGIKDELKDLDSSIYKVLVRNAQGQPTALPQIYTELKGKNVNLIIPIFTPTAQAAKNDFPNLPIVFSAVTDPVGAGIVQSLDKTGGNVTGVSDLFPIDMQLKLITEILPTAKKIGVLYNPGEQNSKVTFKLILVEAQKLGLEVVSAGVTNTNEILTACSSMKGKADVFFTSNDITVATGIDGVVKYCQDNKIPFFAGDPTAVEKGAIGTFSQSYYGIGRLTGVIVKQIINGAKPSSIPVVISKNVHLFLNVESAAKMGVTIPEIVRAKLNQ